MQHCACNDPTGVTRAGSSTSRNGAAGPQCQTELRERAAALHLLFPPHLSENLVEMRNLCSSSAFQRSCANAAQCYQVGRASHCCPFTQDRIYTCSAASASKLPGPLLCRGAGLVSFSILQPLCLGSQGVCVSVHHLRVHSCPKQLISASAAAKLHCRISPV